MVSHGVLVREKEIGGGAMPSSRRNTLIFEYTHQGRQKGVSQKYTPECEV